MRYLSNAIVAALVTAITATGQPAVAQENPSAFYHGKQLKILVGSGAGSGYDINARVLARHWVNHIPGKPSIIIQNMPGAGSVAMTNQLYASGARDGTVIGAAINGVTTAPLLTPDIVKYDIAKLIWLGSTNSDIQITYVWHDAPVQTMKDLLTTELVVGATSAGTTHVDYPVVANALFGTKFKLVSGYRATGAVHLAISRGEVKGFGANGWLSLKALNSDWLEKKQVRIVMQYGMTRAPEFKDVPAIGELAKTEADRQAVELLATRLRYGRPFFLPPDVPAARVEALRRSFDATMNDAAFRADAEKTKLDLAPMKGEEIAPLIAKVMATPKDVVARVRDALAAGAQAAKAAGKRK